MTLTDFLYWLFTKTPLARVNKSTDKDPWTVHSTMKG